MRPPYLGPIGLGLDQIVYDFGRTNDEALRSDLTPLTNRLGTGRLQGLRGLHGSQGTD